MFVELIGGDNGIAAEAVEAALRAGKHVVTANKALLARHGVRLARLAEERGIALNFEAAVAGGIPVIKTMREALLGNEISRVYGILNGTCNYILTTMQEEGRPFAEVLKEAQERGYAEADPTFDIGGFDTAHKLSLLTSLAFGTELAFEDIHIEGIEHITPADIEAADDLGYRIKLLGVAVRTATGIEQRVHPAMVPKHSAIAEVSGVTNCVAIDGDFVGDLLLVGSGAGSKPTASAVASDIGDIARGLVVPPFLTPASKLKPYTRHARPASGCLLRATDRLRPARNHGGDRQPYGGARRFHRKHRQRRPRSALPVRGAAGAGLSDARRPDHPRDDRGSHAQRARRDRARRQGIREAADDSHRKTLIHRDWARPEMEEGPMVNDRSEGLDRVLVLEVGRVTEAAAIAAAKFRGRGNEKAADKAAVDAMRRELNRLHIRGRVVIGEARWTRPDALYRRGGRHRGWSEVDIAVDPLRHHDLCKAMPNSLAVLAIAERGGLLMRGHVHEQDRHRPRLSRASSISMPRLQTISTRWPRRKGVPSVRSRHVSSTGRAMPTTGRAGAGAAVQLIPDGDIAGVIWTTDPEETGIDIYLGSGGAPEGVLAAAALRCIGGQMQGRLMPLKDEERERAAKMGADINRKYTMEDMASGDVIFSATGVTDGSLLEGVHFRGDFAETETVIMRAKTGTVRRIKTTFRNIGTKLAGL